MLLLGPLLGSTEKGHFVRYLFSYLGVSKVHSFVPLRCGRITQCIKNQEEVFFYRGTGSSPQAPGGFQGWQGFLCFSGWRRF